MKHLRETNLSQKYGLTENNKLFQGYYKEAFPKCYRECSSIVEQQ